MNYTNLTILENIPNLFKYNNTTITNFSNCFSTCTNIQYFSIKKERKNKLLKLKQIQNIKIRILKLNEICFCGKKMT